MESLFSRCVGVRRYSGWDTLRLRVATALAAGRARGRIRSVRTCVLFLGCPRSGHSLVGALLDAHPQAIVAHELDAVRFVERGFSWPQLAALVFENVRQFAASGRVWEGYSYEVPGAWQGAAEPLLVLGDKKGVRTTRRLAADPALLRRLDDRIPARVRFVHVVRNPFDIVATRHRRSGTDPDTLIARTEGVLRDVAAIVRCAGAERVLTVRHERVVADPRRELAALAGFLDLAPDAAWLGACARVVFPAPRRTRDALAWSRRQVDGVRRTIARFPELAGYDFET